jgi:hypothetical protein
LKQRCNRSTFEEILYEKKALKWDKRVRVVEGGFVKQLAGVGFLCSSKIVDSSHLDDGGEIFLRKFGSYKGHAV